MPFNERISLIDQKTYKRFHLVGKFTSGKRFRCKYFWTLWDCLRISFQKYTKTKKRNTFNRIKYVKSLTSCINIFFMIIKLV